MITDFYRLKRLIDRKFKEGYILNITQLKKLEKEIKADYISHDISKAERMELIKYSKKKYYLLKDNIYI